jgi:2-phosphoglycerate kinase
MRVNHAWLIMGIPGVGKTTVSRLLAARFSCGVHLPGDVFRMWILSGAADLPHVRPAAHMQAHVSVHIVSLGQADHRAQRLTTLHASEGILDVA